MCACKIYRGNRHSELLLTLRCMLILFKEAWPVALIQNQDMSIQVSIDLAIYIQVSVTALSALLV